MHALNNEALGVENIRANLEQPGKHIWKIPFFMDTFDEDNDTSSDDSDSDDDSDEEEGSKPDKMVVYDHERQEDVELKPHHGLEFFIKKEKEHLAKQAQKNKAKRKDKQAA